MRWQGFALGFLGLVGLEVLVSSSTATSNFAGIANGVGTLAQKILSPTVPAFSSSSASATTSAANTSTSTAVPVTPVYTSSPSTTGPFYGAPFLSSPPSGTLA